MNAGYRNIGIMVATNTALFTAWDMGEWIGETLSLWSLPANMLTAVIATALAIGLSAAGRTFGFGNAQA
jgi:hypothetical protein